MKRAIAYLSTLLLVLSLTACGDGADKQPAIDAYNACSAAFTTAADIINANADRVESSLIGAMVEVSKVLNEYKAALEHDTLDEAELRTMIDYFQTTERNMQMVAETLRTELGIP